MRRKEAGIARKQTKFPAGQGVRVRVAPGVGKDGSTCEGKREKLETAVAPRSGINGQGIGLGAVGNGEAAKVLEQGVEMANLRASRMAMATRRATTEMLWPRV